MAWHEKVKYMRVNCIREIERIPGTPSEISIPVSVVTQINIAVSIDQMHLRLNLRSTRAVSIDRLVKRFISASIEIACVAARCRRRLRTRKRCTGAVLACPYSLPTAKKKSHLESSFQTSLRNKVYSKSSAGSARVNRAQSGGL